jgi:hypothetical protein
MVNYFRILKLQFQAWSEVTSMWILWISLEVALMLVLNRIKIMIKEGSSTGTTEVFDLGLGRFDSKEGHRMLSEYGEDGRTLYMLHTALEICPYMLVYLCFYGIITSSLCSLAFDPSSKWNYLAVFPLASVIVDCLEDSCIMLLLLRYPVYEPGVLTILAYAVQVKWAFNVQFWVLLVIVLLLALPTICGLERIIGPSADEQRRRRNSAVAAAAAAASGKGLSADKQDKARGEKKATKEYVPPLDVDAKMESPIMDITEEMESAKQEEAQKKKETASATSSSLRQRK